MQFTVVLMKVDLWTARLLGVMIIIRFESSLTALEKSTLTRVEPRHASLSACLFVLCINEEIDFMLFPGRGSRMKPRHVCKNKYIDCHSVNGGDFYLCVCVRESFIIEINDGFSRL
jgi:hypothetical protein